MTIDLYNETDILLDNECENAMRQTAALTLEMECFYFDAEVSITIVTNERIKELNKKYRKIDTETDVLSFPCYELIVGAYDELIKETVPVLLGDIVISIEKAAEQAEQYGHTLKRELSFLACHSVLHLLGHDHLNEEDTFIMFERQKHILNEAGIIR